MPHQSVALWSSVLQLLKPAQSTLDSAAAAIKVKLDAFQDMPSAPKAAWKQLVRELQVRCLSSKPGTPWV
jgi:hypothetical protein